MNYGIDFKGGTLIELRTDLSIKYRCTDINLKSYPGSKNIYTFTLQERTDFGPIASVKFGHAERAPMLQLRSTLMEFISHFEPPPAIK